MKIKLFTLLTAVTLMLSLLIINAMEVVKDTVKIQTSDGQEFEISKELIVTFLKTIKNMLDDLPSSPDTPIPLPNIDGDTFSKVVAVLNAIKDETNENQQEVKAKGYLNKNIKDNTQLVSLILAANYLDFGVLLDASTSILRNRLKISEIDSKDKVTKIAKEIEQLPNEIKNEVLGETLLDFRHYLEVCSIKNTKEFKVKTLKGHTDLVNSVVFSPDGKSIASASRDNTVIIWDIKTGNSIKTLQGHTDTVKSVVFSPDSKYIASGSLDKTIKIWDVETGSILHTLKGHKNFVLSVAFSHDGKYIASGSNDNTIRIWDVNTGNQINILKGHKSSVCSVTFSPDGKYITSGSLDRTIIIWDVETGNQIKIFKGHKSSVCSVTFSPDGKYITSGSLDRTIIIWDVETGNQIKIFKGHKDLVWSVAFSPDGKYIASGSRDKTIKIWDVETGNQIKTLKGHKDQVRSVAFSPDGKHVASGSWDKTIRIWELFDYETWIALNKVITKDIKGNLKTQLTSEQALELIAAINAKKHGKNFELEKITDEKLIKLINQCKYSA